MSDKEQYRVVGDRVITEKQYQSEKSTERLIEAAGEYSFITIPATAIAFFATLFMADINGWFWRILASLFAGFLVYMYILPAIVLVIIIAIFGLISKMGGFG